MVKSFITQAHGGKLKYHSNNPRKCGYCSKLPRYFCNISTRDKPVLSLLLLTKKLERFALIFFDQSSIFEESQQLTHSVSVALLTNVRRKKKYLLIKNTLAYFPRAIVTLNHIMILVLYLKHFIFFLTVELDPISLSVCLWQGL